MDPISLLVSIACLCVGALASWWFTATYHKKGARDTAVQLERLAALQQAMVDLAGVNEKQTAILRELLSKPVGNERERIKQEVQQLEETTQGVLRRPALASVRGMLFDQQDGHCFYCLRRFDEVGGFDAADVDHYVPLAAGGGHNIENLVLACQACNRRKHTMMPDAYFRQLGQAVRLPGQMAAAVSSGASRTRVRRKNKTLLTVSIPTALLDRVRDAAHHEEQPVASIVESALFRLVSEGEQALGEPYPRRIEPPPGRPKNSKNS